MLEYYGIGVTMHLKDCNGLSLVLFSKQSNIKYLHKANILTLPDFLKIHFGTSIKRHEMNEQSSKLFWKPFMKSHYPKQFRTLLIHFLSFLVVEKCFRQVCIWGSVKINPME